jgi:hypothetical protein
MVYRLPNTIAPWFGVALTLFSLFISGGLSGAAVNSDLEASTLFPLESVRVDPIDDAPDPVGVDEPVIMEVGLSQLPDFDEVWNGEPLHWEKALYSDSEVVGSSGIPFGLKRPNAYDVGTSKKYPRPFAAGETHHAGRNRIVNSHRS